MSKNPVNLTLRSKINVVLGSWMYATHRQTVLQPCVKFGKQMSNRGKGMGHTWIHVKNPIYLTLRSKVNIKSVTWIYVWHFLIVKEPCTKYGKPMSNQKIVLDRKQKHVINAINLTLRSKFNIVSSHIVLSWYTHVPNMINQCEIKKTCYGPDTKIFQKIYKFYLRSEFRVIFWSWMYATHRLKLIYPCAKYGKPMSNSKLQLWAGHELAQTDGQTDRVISIYPFKLRSRGYTYQHITMTWSLMVTSKIVTVWLLFI